MNREIRGIHHITAIAGDPQPNLDFYAGLLGLRLVKLTINYDDPGTYHFYYGDGIGSPGTLLTFFPWPGAPRGRHGNSQATGTAFAIPSGAMQYWTERLARNGIALDGPFERFEEQVLSFPDPDGLGIELIEGAAVNAERAYTGGPVPVEYAIHGFHSATLSEEGHGRTAALLTATMGFRLLKQDGSRFRYAVAGGEPGALVDVCCLPEEPQGRMGVGTVHHIAWRTPDDAQQREWLGEITRLGYNVTPVIDRKYFKSIYYREPGGVLFEIATDGPGMSVDEAVEDLGARLQLPPRLEPARAQLEAVLPQLRLPAAVAK